MLNIKHILGAICTITATIASIAICNNHNEQYYVLQGRYCSDGIINTIDGNSWYYLNDTIANNKPLYVVMNDNGTANIKDDIIIDVIVDIKASSYDTLYDELAEKYNNVTRDGDKIIINCK